MESDHLLLMLINFLCEYDCYLQDWLIAAVLVFSLCFDTGSSPTSLTGISDLLSTSSFFQYWGPFIFILEFKDAMLEG